MIAGTGIEVGLQELGSKFGYSNRDGNWVTGIGVEVGLQEIRSKLVPGIEIEVGLGNGIDFGFRN